MRSQRLKRLQSIEAKLRRFPTMRLTQVQDIGGCRAVVSDVSSVRHLVRSFDISDAKNTNRHRRLAADDYISSPKADGYRSIHLIYEYRSTTPQTSVFNGQRVEIQIRSQLQHAWATAVETVDVFAAQHLKAGAGAPEWARFFALVASLFAWREGAPRIPGTPDNLDDVVREIWDLETKLKTLASLHAWRMAVQHAVTSAESAAMYLLHLDARPEVSKLEIVGYKASELAKATDAYMKIEESLRGAQEAQVVLVSVDSAAHLAEAYPSYYADTKLFLAELVAAAKQIADEAK